MKIYLLVYLFCFNLTCVFLQAQISDDISVVPILDDAENYYKKMQGQYYTICKFELDLVSESVSKYSSIYLSGNRTYKILLFGESSRISDIDLKIHAKKSENNWIVIKDVNNSDKLLETTFRPDISDWYSFEIIADKCTSGMTGGRYCLIIGFR